MPHPAKGPIILTTPDVDRLTTLDQFVAETMALCENIVGPWSQLLLPLEYREPLKEAWDEFDRKKSESSFKHDLKEKEVKTHLERAGLSKSQLRLKLKGLADSWTVFKERGLVDNLRKLLKWILVILGSLVALFELGKKWEAFKELIESLELLIGSR